MKKDILNVLDSNKIIPAKIREARISRGLSLSELSTKIGVSSQAISQYELGISTPSALTFIKLVEELDFPSTFFYQQVNTNSLLSNSATYFRSNKNISKKIKEAFKIRLSWINNVNNYLLKYLDLPKLDLPELNDLLSDTEMDNLVIEEIATKLREHWNLSDSPIPNMVELLQSKGFVISKLEFNNKKVDAFSRWFNGIPYIILGADKNSAVRSRFDLAHELGHLIMHKNINQDDLSKKDILDRIENEADMFAATFLLPINSFNKEVVSSSINHFVILKKRWKVSISAMIRRCQDANILTDNQIRYLKSQMIKYGYYKREPLDDEIIGEKPYLFKQAFNVLVENNIITKQELLDIISLNSKEAETIFCLDENYFNSNVSPINITLVN
ncbi:XRE family transcriptional regulator [Clostridium botulinum]|uniref:ImmA/IrrE family metallo-endopeptidase n=1 Tax=Clostridium botulinum TaxID=1491 RepID=A0A6B4JNS7_CLOBO|nr:XRE family transcriptional regulator [Clostridium botulinum]EES49304.1 transcriptional regulator [Clostridium botulinum E1 str. 'BoNT E Beluga']MBY6761845.1 ImmA/IrrE family metallo-endopeptidase [Clostridium botulinum]MBY6920771.1 ImmA/IrrE family metallo-endopeptidase [Clostridium botulinum]MCR1131481.1 XRE family transcriptional regulator [Clostridium botulinum]NFJ58614.1 ImmA/IrrE family metallo-endopeptidase [Clostridium botulinum]